MMRELLTTAASAALTFALPGWAPAVFATEAAAILPDAVAPAPDDTDLNDQPPRNQPRRGLKYDGLVRAGNEGRCAHGFRLAHGDACTHGPDPAPAGLDVTRAGAPDPLVFPPGEEPRVQCDGDGQSGSRVQVLYVRYSDAPDRYAEYADSIRQWTADASRIVGDSAAETGGLRHIRFVHDADCRLDIADEALTTGDWIGQLRTRGYDRADRKYLVFFDASSYCGIAFPPGFDDNDTPTNLHNTGGDFGRVDTACWNGRIAAHELVHLLGGVQLSAPHSSGGYHCTDEWDQLCYSDFPDFPSLTYDCADQAHNALLDCNHDDYFHTDPARGSYLDTHWNVADSTFLAGFVRISSGPAGPTADPSPTFTFAADQSDVAYECRLEGPAGTGATYQPCASPRTYADLVDGDYTFEVRALDPTGATDPSPARSYFSPDTVLPETVIDSGPEGLTTDPTLVFGFSADQPGAGFQCRLDGPGGALGTFVPCTSPTTYYDTQVPDGDYSFSVRAVDPAGNVDPTPASRAVTVDAPAPQTFVDLICGVLSCDTFRDTTPTFRFSSNEPEASFECRLDGPGSTTSSWAACTPPATYGPLADGAYTFAVRATDSSGATDPSPATYAYTVDTIAPQTTIDSGPTGPTNDPTPTFTFSASETVAPFHCSLDGSAFAECATPYTTRALGDGEHSLRVRSMDWAINTDPTPAVRYFTVDTVVPETTIDSGPSGSTTDELTTFTFSASEPGVDFECRLMGTSGGAFETCTSPRSYDLPNGDYTFEVRASDAAGNTDLTPASRAVTVAAPPQTTIASAPPAATSSTTATFVFSSDEPGSAFECRLDGPGSVTGGYEACASPRTWTGLADGTYAVEVRATASGVIDPTPARHEWTVDTVSPQTTIDSGPSGPITDDTPTFTFSTDEPAAFVQCRLDGSAYSACASPYTTAPLTDGAHTFEVRAVDAAGNADPTPAVRELSGVHEWGYAEAYHLLTGEPRLQRSRNSAGLQNSIASSGTGSYTVTFPGLGRSGGVVQVTASGSERRYCKVADWATGGGGPAAQVRCFAPDGSPANARFAIGYARAGAVLPGTRFAYLVANAPGALGTYNATGAANELIRISVGRYEVRLPDVGGPGAVKITGYGAGSDTCTLVDWYPSGSVEVVEVACHNAGGAAVDAAFALTFHGPEGVLGVRTTGSGRAWVRSDNPTASSYTPGPNDRFNSTGGTDTIMRTGTGSYQVRLHGLATAFGTAHVTGVSRTGTSIRCQASWSSDAADELVSVSCFDRRGHAVNARFVMTFVD